MILDEPTSGLDAQNMRRVGALIEEIRKKATKKIPAAQVVGGII